MKQYICIDIGGTEIKHGVLDENEKFLAKGKVPTEAFKGGPALLKKVMGIAADYLKDRKTEGICVSTAGMVDVEKGEIFYAAPLIPEYAGTKIKASMEAEFGLPCEVENDVNCAGLAEAVSGAAAGAQSALCLTVGTGIGGCIIIGGRVYHGWSGSACEVGYMHMDGSDFQTLGAASILVKRVAAAKGEPEAQWNGYRIFQLAGEGDSICVEAIDQMCDCLGKGISNICYVLNPQIVVLGGESWPRRRTCVPDWKRLLPGTWYPAYMKRQSWPLPGTRMTRGCGEPTIISWRGRERPGADRYWPKAGLWS